MDSHLDNEYRQQRLANLGELEARGRQPFGQAFARDGRIAEVRAAFADGKTLRAAGRLVAKRDMGKSVFAALQDASGKFQIYLKKDALPEADFDAFRFVDLGDHVGVEGECFTTRTGEPTLKVASWTLLGKSL